MTIQTDQTRQTAGVGRATRAIQATRSGTDRPTYAAQTAVLDRSEPAPRASFSPLDPLGASVGPYGPVGPEGLDGPGPVDPDGQGGPGPVDPDGQGGPGPVDPDGQGGPGPVDPDGQGGQDRASERRPPGAPALPDPPAPSAFPTSGAPSTPGAPAASPSPAGPQTPDDWAAHLRQAAPSAQTAALLGALESEQLSPRGRIDALAVLERHAAWFAARQVHLLADIAAHAEAAPPSSERDIDTQLLNNGEYAAEEVACALRISNSTATERLQIAKELAGQYANTLGLLEGGEICYMQARNLANACRVLEPKAAARVESAMATKMPTQATGQSSRALRRQVIKADPEGYQRRLELGTKEREIVRYPQDDGMVTWGATVPAELGARFDQAVDAHATTLVVDDRTLSQRRVDALADLILNRPVLLSGPSHTPATPEAPTPHQSVPGRPAPATALVHVTVPLDVLIGASEDPAELKGYGPVTATQARTIAFAEGTIWRRLITHPKTGLLIKTDPTTYRPSAEAERHVVARDQQCAFPSCRMPAQRCDLDHVKEFDHAHPESGGQTVPENLIPICRRHHLMKHRGNWTVTRDSVTGITTWVSPTGHIYLNTPRNYAE
ncbi:DUF222 domain-containing protein [Streptomyces sp. NBC_01471]|uniref:DUF222 domain-containing protein n=1 Tax=Streptomyces sp. NBC_01471 TaxID=2903879 RepID=UPI003247CDCF